MAEFHLTENGIMELIVPIDVSLLLQNLALDFKLYTKRCIKVRSYEKKAAIRHIVSLSKQKVEEIIFHDFCIYSEIGIHSIAYKAALKDFFTIF